MSRRRKCEKQSDGCVINRDAAEFGRAACLQVKPTSVHPKVYSNHHYTKRMSPLLHTQGTYTVAPTSFACESSLCTLDLRRAALQHTWISCIAVTAGVDKAPRGSMERDTGFKLEAAHPSRAPGRVCILLRRSGTPASIPVANTRIHSSPFRPSRAVLVSAPASARQPIRDAALYWTLTMEGVSTTPRDAQIPTHRLGADRGRDAAPLRHSQGVSGRVKMQTQGPEQEDTKAAGGMYLTVGCGA
ncbi:hypothetical protein B0H19DRAFT_1376829 [Mycena capillaripes]|nr:hypothetical protein B0H19DRAFT_1376829 [Mycena capillaripes]